ncbi:VapE domain-containing protein, partial [Prevotella sp. HJM029]|uniref:VapE domain-containing protein n=1 Tax=Prevotella sp. HJM029 TaxID=1433844 RepID=UPI00048D11E6
RTEYRSKEDAHFSKVGRYEINTLRRELDNDVGIITSSDNLYSIIESSFSPRVNPIQEYFKRLPLVDVSSSSPFSLKAIPHLASFVASVNGNDFLTDPTGSRRLLPFEVLSIDIQRAKAISMDNVYAEAKALLNMGFRYWFDDDEIAELYRESEDFQVQTAEMELLLCCFEKPTEDESYSLMTTTEILTYLGIYTHQPLVAKRMGEALKKAGYIKVSKRRNGGSPIYVYKIRKILPCPLLQTCSSQM